MNYNSPDIDLITTAKICPYCQGGTEYIDSSQIYGKSYGMVYICRPCDAYVGVHDGTNQALGRLANKELRYWKKQAHAFFDPLWQRKIKVACISRTQARKSAYKWLSKELGIPHEYTHIGMFDIKECQKTVEICRKYTK